MATVTSNKAAVLAALGGLAATFKMTRTPNGRKRLGDELAETAAGAIVNRSVNRQQDPGGSPWAALKPAYRTWKAKRGFDTRINIKTHEMLDFGQVLGVVTVADDAVTMTAGLDDETRVKVEAAEEGGRGRPKRPFYDLGADGEAAVDALADETIDAAVKAAEGA